MSTLSSKREARKDTSSTVAPWMRHAVKVETNQTHTYEWSPCVITTNRACIQNSRSSNNLFCCQMTKSKGHSYYIKISNGERGRSQFAIDTHAKRNDGGCLDAGTSSSQHVRNLNTSCVSTVLAATLFHLTAPTSQRVPTHGLLKWLLISAKILAQVSIEIQMRMSCLELFTIAILSVVNKTLYDILKAY